MNLLAIDSSCSVLSTAVCRGEEIFYTETEAGVRHSELVMPAVDTIMKKAGLKPQDLNGVICMGGPGSFTGLRIGYSIAKGLALSLSIPFTSVPTLDCMAFPHREEPMTLITIEARKNSFYYAMYQYGKLMHPVAEGSLEDIGENIKYLKTEKRGYAKELIYIAKADKLFEKDNNAFLLSGPEYVRKTDAEMNLSRM